jgi:hypothetical protein
MDHLTDLTTARPARSLILRRHKHNHSQKAAAQPSHLTDRTLFTPRKCAEGPLKKKMRFIIRIRKVGGQGASKTNKIRLS